jgi:Zn-dependent peptidase ImmA (M78 family)/transcriptional regulator with XRE-family HTH domain
MTQRPFDPARLRLARELKGWSQAELAARLGATPAAVSQFESGAAHPSAKSTEQLGRLLEVPVRFFGLPLVETHEGFFRSLRRTSVTHRRRARAIAHIAHDLATYESAAWDAQHRVPEIPAPLDATRLDVEGIAGQVRDLWKLAPGPAPGVVDLLESHRVVVMRLPLDTADVDAFSLPFPDRPVVVLGSDKNDRARSRFDAAHELGHLVMHGDQVWGMPEVEQQAHSFGAAFLMPAADIYHELPQRADWPRLFELKRRWQVSLAALLMRAKTLGRMSDANYLAAVKAASARGWRRVEPVPLGPPEQPRRLIELMKSSDGGPAASLQPRYVVQAITNANAG